MQWAQEATQGNPESKIIIDSGLIHKVIPRDFSNVDWEDKSEKVSEKKELENLRRELSTLWGEKNNQTEFKAVRFNSLLVLRQIRGQFNEQEYQDYEGKINTATSREEIEVIEKEFLLKAKQKNISPKPVRGNKDKKEKDKLAEIERQNKIFAGQLQLNNDEMEKLKREIQNLQKQGNKGKTLSVVVITILIIWGVYGMLKLLTFFKGMKKQEKIN